MGSDLHWAIKDHQERTYGKLLEAIRRALIQLEAGDAESARLILLDAQQKAKFEG